MKLLTRYLLANLVRPWLYILFGFSAIAVLVDLFDGDTSIRSTCVGGTTGKSAS